MINKIKTDLWNEVNDYGSDFNENNEFLDELKNKSGNVLISGYTIKSAKEDIIKELEEENNIKFKKIKNKYYSNCFILPLEEYKDIKFFIKGAGRNNDEKSIMGMTLLAWFPYNLENHKQDFIDMAKTRLSRDDSFIFNLLEFKI